MANYYVSTSTGNDTTGNGSLATPWATIGKAIGSTPAITLSGTGDTLYIAPGTYREIVTIGLSPTSAGPLTVVGDVANAQGFSGVAGGAVIWTAYTTNDKTAPGVVATISLNGKSYLTFQNLWIVGGQWNQVSAIDAYQVVGATNITFSNCAISGIGGPLVRQIGTAAGGPDVWLFDRCRFFAASPFGSPWGSVLQINTATTTTAGTGTGSDYNRQITLQNCVFVMATNNPAVYFTPGAGTFKPGGLVIKNCTVLGCNALVTADTGVSANIPVRIQNCRYLGQASTSVFNAIPVGTIVECNNLVGPGASIRNNVGTDPNTVTAVTYNPALLNFGQETLWGGLPEPAFVPLASSPDLGWSNNDYAVGYASTAADDATVGTVAWTTPANALVRENTVAYAVATSIPATTGVSHYLDISNLGSLVPTGATIKNVRVEVIANASAAGAIGFNSVKLIKGGIISGNDHAADVSGTLATSDAIYSFATATDPLWWLTLLDTDVNAANFGVAISMKNTAGTAQTANIDLVRIIVGYTTSTPLAVDLFNRPRPSAGQTLNAAGAMERANTGVQDTTTVHTASGSSVKLAGPSYHEFQVPVDAASTTLSIWARYDTAANAPEFRILAAPELGIANDVVGTWTDPGINAWAQISCAAQTPTAKGVLTVRVRNTGTNAAANCWFDDAAIA